MQLYQYTDYKLFLADFFTSKKTEKNEFSYGMWARALGLKTTASLTMIVNGERHPGPKLRQQFKAYFKFNKDEAAYLDDLVHLKKSEAKDIALYLGLLRKIKSRNSVKYNLLSEEIFKRIGKWYYFALREMVCLESFKNDPVWIADKLIYDVSVDEIQNAIDDLTELGLIECDGTGGLRTCTDGLNTYDEMPSESIRNFHRQMLSNAERALDEIPVDKRYISALTIPVNSKNLDKLKKFVRKVEDEILEMFVDDNPDCVYQCSLQLFPLTKEEE